MHNPVVVNQFSLGYSLSAPDHLIFAKTSLASQTDQPPKPKKLPGKYGKFLNSNSINWLLAEKIAIEKLAIASQVHGSNVRYVSSPGIYRDIDGFYTDQPEIFLTIRTADCAVVFVSAPEIPAVGIAHAGWRGANANIVANLIGQMSKRWDTDPALFLVAVSPHIKQCCYSVGDEFKNFFKSQYLRRKSNQLYLDLEKVIIDQLIESGIRQENLAASQHCTSCGSLPLYSYRAQQKTANRLLSVVAIQE